MTPPKVIQQGCLGLAGAIEADPSYVSPAEARQAADYRGPAVGNQTAPIDPDLFAQYDFEPRGIMGDVALPSTWRLNSVDNYVRYHTATLLERHRLSDNSEPISVVILGCTHFPYYTQTIAESLRRLRDFRRAGGDEPYRNLVLERPSFIDPAELTARQLYENLAVSGLLIDKRDRSVISVDEFYISVPNASLAGAEFADGGGFTYEYKYGRATGNFEYEYVKRVPVSNVNLSPTVCERIKTSMPGVWSRLVAFSQRSPRTRDLSDSARLVAAPTK
jgi:hypothetical protein